MAFDGGTALGNVLRVDRLPFGPFQPECFFLFGFLGLWIEAAERALMGQGVEFIGFGVARETAQGLFEDQLLDAFHELGIWQIGLPARGGHELE